MTASIFQKLQKSIPLFHDFSIEEIEIVLKTSPRKHFKKGEYIFRHGSMSSELYVVLSGMASMVNYYGDYSYLDKPLKYGDVFGIEGFLLNRPRSEDIIVESDILSAVIISQRSFQRNMTIATKLYQFLATYLSKEMRYKNGKISDYKYINSEAAIQMPKLPSNHDKNRVGELVFLQKRLSGLSFYENQMENSSFNNSRLNNSSFSRNVLNMSEFGAAKIEDSSFNGCDFHDADFSGTTLKSVAFANCTFNGIDIRGLEVDS